MSVSLDGLHRLCLEELFLTLDLPSSAALIAVNRRMRDVGSSDHLWKERYDRDVGIPLDKMGRTSWYVLCAEFGGFVGMDGWRLAKTVFQAVKRFDPAAFEAGIDFPWRRPDDPWCGLKSPEGRLLMCLKSPVDFGAIELYNVSVTHRFAMPGTHMLTSRWLVWNGMVVEPFVGGTARVVGRSVAGLIESWAVQVEQGKRNPKKTFFMIGPDVPTRVTRGVEISVAVEPVAAMAENMGSIVYVYEVRIRGLANVDRCQLTTRHWDIVDNAGDVQVVDGPGVVGLTPIVERGSSFQYRSCCPVAVHTLPGFMEGYFVFRILGGPNAGEEFRADVPRFTFDCFETVDFSWDV